jgi:phenylalanyl-tRNA synthetase alpha subunit
MDLNKIFEWLRQPVKIDEQDTENIQTQIENEEVKQTQQQEEVNQQTQQQQIQNQQEQKQMNIDLPGIEYLTNADLHDINVGRQRFIAKYANFENLNSLLQTIEPIAYRQYVLDIQAGRKQGDYYTYLERAKDLTFEATKTLVDQLRRLQQYNPYYIPNRQQGKRPYTVKDLMRDYKKALPYITTKYHMIYHMDDQTVDRGRLDLSTPSGLPIEKQ